MKRQVVYVVANGDFPESAFSKRTWASRHKRRNQKKNRAILWSVMPIEVDAKAPRRRCKVEIRPAG